MKSLEYTISEELRNRARTSTFILTVFLITIALIYFLRAHEGEIFPSVNTFGIQVISNTLNPEKHEKRAERIGSSHTITPFERQAPEKDGNTRQIKHKKEREEMGKLLLLYSIFK